MYNISIIIPVYKTEHLLRRCLESIYQYSINGIEIVVVSDSRSLECANIILKYQKKYENIRYIEHENNKGLLRTRITGIQNARGEFIAHLDSDDYIIDDIYNKAFEESKKTDSKIILWEALEIDGNHKNHLKLESFKKESGRFCFEKILDSFSIELLWHTSWNKLIHNSLYRNIDLVYKNEHIIQYEDLFLSTFIYLNNFDNKSISCINEIGIHYIRHDNSSTKSNLFSSSLKRSIDTISVINLIKTILTRKELLILYKQEFSLLQKVLISNTMTSSPSEMNFKNNFLFFKLKFKYLFNGYFEALFPMNEKKVLKKIVKKVISLDIKEVCIFGNTNSSLKLAKILTKNRIKVNYFISTRTKTKVIDSISVEVPNINLKNEIILIPSIASRFYIKNLLEKSISSNINYIMYDASNINKIKNFKEY